MARRFDSSSSSSSSRSSGWRRSDTAETPYPTGLLTSSFVEMNYEAEVGEVKKCLCKLKAPRFTPWKTDKNPGRRYFGCPNWTWKDNEIVHFCKYFEWYDAKFTERSVFLIRSLRNERDWYKRQLATVESDRDDLRQERVDWIDDREAMGVELRVARANEARRVVEIQEMATAMDVLKEKNVKLILGLIVVGVMLVIVCVCRR